MNRRAPGAAQPDYKESHETYFRYYFYSCLRKHSKR